MENDQSHMTRVLNITLEIFCLLTGQHFSPLKFGDYVTITVPPPHSLISGSQKKQNILELTRKMTELLTGEVSIRCEDITVYFSMEEWQYLEGHKDFYKDTMIENQPPLTSPDRSSNRNPPEGCADPLYSQDCPQEDPTIHHHIKVEELIDGLDMSNDLQSVEEGELMGMIIKEEVIKQEYTEVSPGVTNHSEIDYALSPHCGLQDDFVKQESPGWNLITPDIPPGPPCPSNLQEADARAKQRTHTGEKAYTCSECGKCFSGKLNLAAHKRSHLDKGSFSCTECGERFVHKSHLSRHELSHTNEKPFSCSECGKWFIWKGNLVAHQKSHTGYSCSECGKYFACKSQLTVHARSHPHKTLSCHVCGKCFVHKSQLLRHERAHGSEKPFSCSVCGKLYAWKSSLVAHERSHTGDKPHSCSECGKCFLFKSYLVAHERAHRLKKQYR
ncbi:zinc finger protein 547-like isoform X2 [Hyperolius riggenbachi]